MIEYGLEWHSLTSYFQFKEITAPGTPQTNQIRLYAKDNGSNVSTLCYKADNGSETCLPTAGSVIPTVSGGAAGGVAFWLDATTLTADAAHFFWNDTNDQLLIGINSGSHLGTDAGLLVDEDASSSIIGTAAHSATVTHAGALNLLRSRGTHASQTIVASGDRIARIIGQGYDGAAYRDTAAIDVEVDGTPASGDMPGRLLFLTTLDGTTTLVERMRLDNVGDLGIGMTPGVRLDITATSAIASTRITRVETATGGPSLIHRKARGTVGSESTVSSGDTLSLISLQGHDGSAYGVGATIDAITTQAWTGSAHGATLRFFTTNDGSTTNSERFRVGQAGQWGIGGATFGSSGDIFSSGGASAAPTWVTRATLNAALDHGTLAGLADDDHTQYALLAGRSGGQTLKGGTAASDTLTLQSTDNATRGNITTDAADITMVAASKMRMAGQNRFRYLNSAVTVFNSAVQSLATGTETILTFDSELFDTDTLHSTSSNTSRLTAALTGKYLFFGVIEYAGNATGERLVGFRKNGGGTLFVSRLNANSTANPHDAAFSRMIDLAATDYIELIGYQSSGGNLNVNDTGTIFGMVYMGE